MRWRSRLIGVTVGLAAAVAIAGQRHRRAELPILPENEGAITSVEVQYDPSSPELTRCLGSFVRQISPEVAVIAACPDERACVRFRELATDWGRRSVGTVSVGAPITGWSKDRFLVTAGHPATLVMPRKETAGLQSRTNDQKVAPALARAFPGRFRTKALPIRFDSGDILATRDALFVSDVLWGKNEHSGFGSKADLATYLRRTFRREVVWLSPAPPHHIGMFLAPLDDKTVAVGDPGLGRRLWNSDAPGLAGKPDFTEAAVRPFHAVMGQLRQAGFRVVPVPCLYFEPQVYLTYTNGVFETRGGRHIAYMPVYGVNALDSAARQAYEAAGCEVRPVPVSDVFRHRGTIGCLVNVLERNQP